MRMLSKTGGLLAVIAAVALSLCAVPLTAHAANDVPAGKAAPATAIAQQGQSTYRVAFKANGGEGSMKAQAVKRGKKAALRANGFTRAGYKFAGWNTRKDGKGKSYRNKAKVKNLAKAGKTVKLYAQWKKSPTTEYKSAIALNSPITIGGKTFYTEQVLTSSGRHTCRIIMKENGGSRILVYDANAAFVTNGRYLFYSRYVSGPKSGGWQSIYAIYRLDLDDGSQEMLVQGPELEARACSGKYLYYGIQNGEDGLSLYALNLNTKQSRHMIDGVGGVSYGSGHVVTDFAQGQAFNMPIYVFKENGTARKKVADAHIAVIKNGKVYYSVVRWSEGGRAVFKTYSCTFAGKGRKATTGWSWAHL